MNWVCEECGHIHQGDDAPEECPICGAPKEEFSSIDLK
jgi:rubrerythrin|tara:strand:- start:924 stop:1037 length:114 start_codon:yes stop_codon:yes gene_type:complete